MYDLTRSEIAMLPRLGDARQFVVVGFGNNDGKYLGDLVPVMVMHETKQQEVKQLNKDVHKRFRDAVKRMGKPLN